MGKRWVTRRRGIADRGEQLKCKWVWKGGGGREWQEVTELTRAIEEESTLLGS